MNVYRLIALSVAAISAGAMLYVGLYQSRFVGRLICPIFADGCEGVADAPFARPSASPTDISAPSYGLIAALLFTPAGRGVWFVLLALSSLATLANFIGVRDMTNLGYFCFYCVSTTVLSPVLLWAVWELG
jgi:hypothetical protein